MARFPFNTNAKELEGPCVHGVVRGLCCLFKGAGVLYDVRPAALLQSVQQLLQRLNTGSLAFDHLLGLLRERALGPSGQLMPLDVF